MQRFELNQKITNENGAWVILRNDPNGGTLHSGIWYAEVYAADFPEHITSHTMAFNKNRARVERGMRQWLANR